MIFYRGHWCGHCCEQLTSLAREVGTFRALGVSVVAISADDFVGANDMCNDLGGVIDVYSDPDATAIHGLGIPDRDEHVDHIIARPAVYIVDDDGIVRYRYISRSPMDRPTSALLALGAESLSRNRQKEPRHR